MATTKRPDTKDRPSRKNALEMFVFGLSMLLVIGTVGYLGYEAWTFEARPPDLAASYTPDPTPNMPFRYHITVANSGEETAEEVEVELVMTKGSIILERASVNVPFVPRESKREAWISFITDPASADTVTATVISYRKP